MGGQEIEQKRKRSLEKIRRRKIKNEKKMYPDRISEG